MRECICVVVRERYSLTLIDHITNISDLLNREVDDTIKKTRDVLLELVS